MDYEIFYTRLLNYVHMKNYCYGKTTNERFAKRATNSFASSASSESSLLHSRDESFLGGDDGNNGGRRGRKKSRCCGCWLNCKQMCCFKKIPSQKDLLSKFDQAYGSG